MAKASKTVLKYDPRTYELDALKSGSLSLDEMQKEYARLRNIANARLNRFDSPRNAKLKQTQQYKQNVGRYRIPATQLTERQLAKKLTDVADFLQKKGSSVSGARSIITKEIDALHLQGYDFINKSNYWEFVDFMDEIQTRYRNKKIPDSDRIVELWGNAQKLKVSNKQLLKDIDKWKKHRNQIEKLVSDVEDGKYSTRKVKEMIKQFK